MTRTEITEEAKQAVLQRGPASILEFGDEMIRAYRDDQWTEDDIAAVLAEAVKQAHRVYRFLGYQWQS